MPQVESHKAVGPPPIATTGEVPAGGAPLAARIEALQAPIEFDSEGDLARRLAEVLSKPVKRASLSSASRSATRDEPVPETEIAAPQANIVEAAEHRDEDIDTRRLRRVHVRRAAETDPAVTGSGSDITSPGAEASAETDETVLPPQASAWVRTARRQRARAVLKSAASWIVSVSVSATIIAVAAWILLGRPMDMEALRELTRGMLDFG